MLREAAYTILIGGGVLIGFWLSNIAYDKGVPHYLSRKIGHIFGGVAFLLCVLLFDDGLIPLFIAVAFTIVLGVGRKGGAHTFRGVGGSGRNRTVMSEVWFPLSAVILVIIGWLWLNEPMVMVACLLMLSWGDAVTGLVRHRVYGRPVKGAWGSLAMFIVCALLVMAFVRPLWVGFVMAGVATLVEWACGDVGLVKKVDDNIAIPLASFGAYLIFYFTLL